MTQRRPASRRPFPRRLAAAAARLVGDRRGATAVEYGLIIAMIVLVMLVALAELAGSTIKMWNKVDTEVQGAR